MIFRHQTIPEPAESLIFDAHKLKLNTHFTLVTRSSQAQRILLNLDLVDYIVSLFKENEPVSYKIHEPKVLKKFQLYCLSKLSAETLSELQNGSRNHERLADSIMEQLEVSAKYRHLVLDAVAQMCKFYSDLKLYEEKCNIPLSENILQHQKLFLSTWSSLTEKRPPESLRACRHDDEDTWGYLGFQTPLSDFRRTGLLGLMSLEHMVASYPELSRRTLATSSESETWLPFALVSINVTSWVMDFYNENELNAFSYNNDYDPLETFYLLHASFFFNFINFYMAKGPVSVLEFNRVAAEYKGELLNKLKQLYEIKDKVDSAYGTNLVNYLQSELETFNLSTNYYTHYEIKINMGRWKTWSKMYTG
ncbi:uncharacterized protein TOT_020000907 [Theileria orientalis strain Shintoku]|uniref:ELMO domain-containing protein n=1 Tax=Theileria orientalis strain Shintoku TaxID=869250 RepID=J4C8E6_THEOR|nr:uncharacterized protein TOT_020000907 [Theileria orientalis strain Shintoku]BAM40653.1 uncharacterized protein TOT_020000907 [Theileria orientalis strain Shintoku]|eukprot:XP_009690954.1 uncharacterized protein TOT_020000907 [Theileria orientalis strain Shintoku]